MQAKFRTGDDRKGKQNLYLLTMPVDFMISLLACIYFTCDDTRGTDCSNIAVYGSATQLVTNLTQFWSLTVIGAFFYCDYLN